jgi:hypothetical protein
MSPEARLARARDMGFDTDRVLYHGTESGPFDAFKLGLEGASKLNARRPTLSNTYVTFASDPKHASEYGDTGSYMVRGKIKDYDLGSDVSWYAKEEGYDSPQDYIDDFGLYKGAGIDDALADQSSLARSEGYDGVRLKLGDLYGRGFADNSFIGGDIVSVFDPRNIRSVNAAFDPARAGENGLLLSDTGRPSLLGSAIASGAEQGKPIRAYHGTRFASEPLDTYPVTDRMASVGDAKKRLWASSDADVASSYAEPIGSDLYWNELYPSHTGHTPPPRSGGVFPVEMNFANPLEVDAAGAGFQSVPWEGQIYSADELAYLAQAMGHDGLILKSLQDHMYDQNHAPSTVYAALKRGTVRSPLTGETLFSDTGRPNAVGAALASSNENAVRSFHGTRYNVKGQFIPSDDGLLGPGVYSSVDPQKAGAHSGYNRGSIENPVMNYEHGKIFPFDVAQPVATEADWMRVLSDMEGAAPRVDQDRSVAVRAQQALANEGFGSVRYGDTVNTFAKGNITSPLTGETLFSDTGKPSPVGSAIAAEPPRTVPEQFSGKAPVGPGLKSLGRGDDTGAWFLDGDKPVYTNARRSSLDLLFGPEYAARFDEYPSVTTTMHGGTPHTTWYKPGEEARAKLLGEIAAEPALKSKDHHRRYGQALGYPDDAIEAYVMGRDDLLSDTGRPSLLGSAIASGAEQGPMRVYHGTDAPSFDKFSGHPWFTPDSRFADFYANGKEFGSDYRDGARVIAGEISPKNPYMVPRGMEIDGGYALSDLDEAATHFGLNPERVDWPDIENAAKASGHDFMVHDINDPGGRQLQYQALAEGSVRSPYTGETLFSDTRPSLLGSALASEQGKEDWINYLLRP